MTDQQPRTFADHVADYAQAGWGCILPVPAETKFPPPVGFTGEAGRDTDPLTLVGWAQTHAHDSIALRMPADVIGIDVDHYTKGGLDKRGADTLAAHIEKWGPLPATWTSTAREATGPSRIYFFRVPAQRYGTKLGADIDIIQRHHRYAVVWPSVHVGLEGGAAIYRWYDPAGRAVDAPPKPAELPELPPAWVAGLVEGATEAGPAAADIGSGQVLLDQLLEDWRPECADLTSARLLALSELGKADAGSRHDTMTGRVHHLVQLAAAGHTGVARAIAELRETWEQLTAGEDRGRELDNMLLTSARKAVPVVGTHQVPRDPCLLMAGFPMPDPAPASPGGADGEADPELQILEPPRWASVREVIGTAAFDPNAGLDQSLAERVLERTYPALRFAWDTGGWLLRTPQSWELHGRLSPWAVAQVATLMPLGDPTAEKGSEPFERAKRRTRLMSTPGARAVAGKMDDLVSGGMHPASLALSDLDADPNILWAGGAAWSLRGSLEVPTLAPIDPATPHLHTTAVAPLVCPTPLWDAFLAAVWPDPELRAWALRVLAIALTGYADRALPILLGETGRGKTQVVHLLMSVLGSYAHSANPKLLSSATNEHDTIVFDLKGRRLSFIDEAPSEAKVGQERLKQLTGGGELTGRRMNQDPITFRPTHTFVLTANDEPTLTDPAVRSRVRLIPCEGDPEAVRQTRAAIGHISSAAWRAEAPGVLAAMMAQAAGWLADPTTAHVTAAPENVRWLAENLGAEQDPVAVWLTEETEPFEAGTASRELYQAFVASCRRNSMRPDAIPSETKWGRVLTRHGVETKRAERGKRRLIRVRSGDFMPSMSDPQTPSRSVDPTVQANRAGSETPSGPASSSNAPTGSGHAQLDGSDAQFLHGSEANCAGTKPQVNPQISVNPAQSAQFDTSLRTHAGAHTRVNSGSENAANCASDPSTREPSKPKRERSAEATAKAALVKAEKRAAAIAEKSGATVELPALVLRDGSVRHVGIDDADALLATITSTRAALTVDVEHTGYPAGHRDFALRTVQLGNENFAVVLDPDDGDQADVVRRHLAAATALHAHVAVADLAPLGRAGLLDLEDAWARMYDTSISAKLANPASESGLKELARDVLGSGAVAPGADAARSALFKAGRWLTDVSPDTPIERSGWAQVDPHAETMLRYSASDVLDTAGLARQLGWPVQTTLDRERKALRMVARVAEQGLRIDGDHVRELLTQQRTAQADAAERLAAFGIDNPGSDQQVGAALERLGLRLPRTPSGKPSVAKGAIEIHAHAPGPLGDLVRARLDYQVPKNRIGLFLAHYEQAILAGDGRVYPTVYTLGARTGRMSCVRPNVQQVPRAGGFRACITADPGELLISADFSSVELRVAAALSKDPIMMRMLAEGVDYHQMVAEIVWGPTAGKPERYQAKRKVFGRIYGSGIEGLATADPPVPEPIARAIVDAMDQLTPGLTAWSRGLSNEVKAGRTRFLAYSGREIHLPEGRSYAAPNYAIQGTARELLIDALMGWAKTRWGACPLFPVHDELIIKVPEADAAEALATLTELMATELDGVSIIAEPSEPSYAWKDSE